MSLDSCNLNLMFIDSTGILLIFADNQLGVCLLESYYIFADNQSDVCVYCIIYKNLIMSLLYYL